MKKITDLLNPKKHTDSPIEEILYNEFVSYGITPELQYPARGYFIDLAFPKIKLAIEADGAEWHSTAKQISRDVGREIRLEKDGWTIVRFTGSEIHKNYKYIVSKILLKYLFDELTEEQKMRAGGPLVNHFAI